MSTPTYTLELTAWEVFTLWRILSETFLGTPQRITVTRKVADVHRKAAPPR